MCANGVIVLMITHPQRAVRVPSLVSYHCVLICTAHEQKLESNLFTSPQKFLIFVGLNHAKLKPFRRLRCCIHVNDYCQAH
ncbi:hypothetical protein PsorP6_003673 [Peronosclerospora sorghi]|uniref:Uncharacterized protein n=1 Tax=Peronosclerospora sorghi TaxID=230839 RepID=A0ACC0VQ18_9STRA|nr:hypothetical protein PsorP6_003673 [Peronosclerospora sorghi]